MIRGKLIPLVSLGMVIMIAGCGSESSESLSTTIAHNGTTYGTVTSPYTGRVWLDRNLGASQVCTAFDDSSCYGDYYQWGRNYDGHEQSSSPTSSTLASDIDSAGPNFILTLASPNDWTDSLVDDDGSLRSFNWSKTDGSSICPAGFRVPTTDEIRLETIDKDNNGEADTDFIDRTDAFNSFLKLPSAGDRDKQDGNMYETGTVGIIWTNSVSANESEYLYFNADSVNADYTYPRANGFSVRCIKD